MSLAQSAVPTVLVVAGAVTGSGLDSRSRSVVRVVVVIIRVIVGRLVGVVGIISDHLVLPSDGASVAFAAGLRPLPPLVRHGA